MAGRQWIYEYLRADKKRGGDLYKYLRRRGKKRCWKCGPKSGRVDISERLGIVEEKSRIGDWEANTIIGAGHRGAIVTLVGRA